MYKDEFFYEAKRFPDIELTADMRMINIFKLSFGKYKRMRKLAIEFVKEVHRNISESE